MSLRVGTIDAAREHGHRGTAHCKRGSVCRAVDPVCATRDDHCAGRRELPRELGGEHLPVPARRAGSHHGDPRRGREERRVSAHPESERRMVSEIVHADRPVVIARHEQLSADPGGGVYRRDDAAEVHARLPAGCGILGRSPVEHKPAHGIRPVTNRPQGIGRAESADDRTGIGITRLGDRSPRRTRGHLVEFATPASSHLPHHRAETVGGQHLVDHSDTPLLRKSARPTSSTPGLLLPARSLIVHARRRTRSYPRRVSAPRSNARSRAARAGAATRCDG